MGWGKWAARNNTHCIPTIMNARKVGGVFGEPRCCRCLALYFILRPHQVPCIVSFCVLRCAQNTHPLDGHRITEKRHTASCPLAVYASKPSPPPRTQRAPFAATLHVERACEPISSTRKNRPACSATSHSIGTWSIACAESLGSEANTGITGRMFCSRGRCPVSRRRSLLWSRTFFERRGWTRCCTCKGGSWT